MKILRPPRIPTPAQIVNMGLAATSFTLSRFVKRPIVLGNPAMVLVEPGTACQLHCPHCPTGRGELTRASGTLTLENFKRIWDSLHPAPVLLQLWNQGEPFTNKQTPEMIRYATESNCWVKLSTNVELLAKGDLAERVVRSGLYELILSIDGVSPETYNTYRQGGSWENVREGVRKVVEARKKLGVKHPLLSWQYLLFKHTLPDAKKAKQLSQEWGCDRILFKTAQLEKFDREEGEKWLPEESRLRRYELVGDKWQLRRSSDFFCNRIYSTCVIQWDGSVVPCCFDKDGTFEMGNILEDGFDAVWKSEPYQRFRQIMINGKRPAMCSNCTEGLPGVFTTVKM